jgi:D-glycero-D-manno-heptose 1,7-bisphosphate phosphatase
MDKKPAVFLDRDGTLIEEVHYLNTVEKLALIPGAGAAVAHLNRLGIPVFLITNQAGVAWGFFSEAFVQEAHRHLCDLLSREGAHLDGIYYCPHHPDVAPCACRKPAMGMVEQALREHPVDFGRSYVVGDRWSDVALARDGARGILVKTGYGTASLQTWPPDVRQPDHIAAHLPDAIAWILSKITSC